ncbi:glycosyltransferase family 2 protein [Paenibacillus jiagnxiensis]|uniref:glycosyltransferase family 2 protein n=1 Tax=Paenibacillus jiagnxiensis TaxID=3228926 RepID=UPI0033B7E49A
MNDKPLISIIFPVKNEGKHVENTLDSLQGVKTNYSLEVIVVDDASVDNCCDFLLEYKSSSPINFIKTNGVGSSNARNVGAEAAKGEYFVFCDAHLFFEDYWLDNLLEPLFGGEADAVVPIIAPHDKSHIRATGQTLNMEKFRATWNYNYEDLQEVAILPGGCLAIPKTVFLDVNGFERGFRVWGFEDIELSIKLWLFGYRCCVQPKSKVLHVFRKVFPYKMSVDFSDYNMMRLAYSHFSEERIKKCENFIRRPEITKDLINDVLENGVLKQRDNYLKKRKFDDNWFFEKFSINF